jgi:putative ABC transport system permease protein
VSFVRRLAGGLRTLLRGNDAELGEELRAFLEMAVEEKVKQGMSREEAARAVRLEQGSAEVAREEVATAGWESFVETLSRDLRFGVRALRKSRGFTAVAVLTLGVSIGASTAVFSIVDAVLLKTLPYPSAERLAAVWSTEIGQPQAKIFTSYRDFEAFQSQSHSFEQLAALTWARAGQILTRNGSPHEVLAIPASAEFFSVLGAEAWKGRTFGSEDRSNACTVVLSHSFWEKELGGPADVIGSPLTLDGQPCTVAGVMNRKFEFYPKATSLWVLITTDGQFASQPLASVVAILGRLKPGVSLARAESELDGLHQRVVGEAPPGSWVAGVRPIVRDLRTEYTWLAGRNLRRALLILFASAGLLLLIACLNVANLLLGRCAERVREIGVRMALGSSRSRLLRQSLTESVVLASLGTAVGIALAVASVRYFNRAALVELPPGNSVAVDIRVLGFAILLTTLTALLFGLWPAWRASEVDPNEALKESALSIARRRRDASQWLVIGQMALTILLLEGAGLLTQSVVRLGAEPMGFRPEGLLTAEVVLPSESYAKLGRRSVLYERLIARLAALPGVTGAALSSTLPPYNGGASSPLAIAGKAPIEGLEAVNTIEITSDYFRVMAIPRLEGREFDSRDQEGSERVAIVNHQFARKYFRGASPLGAHIKLGKAGDDAPWLAVSGIVGDEKRTTVYQEMGFIEPAMVYLPLTQASSRRMAVVLRVQGDAKILGPSLQNAVAPLDKNVPVYQIETMSERYAQEMAHPRFRAALMAIFAGLTLLVAAIGLYGRLARLVSQRTHEIGIRMALGASRREVLRMVVAQGLRMTAAGLGIGIFFSLGASRFLSSLLFAVRPTDASTLAGVVCLFSAVAFLACYLPARRATRVDPMMALRHE